MKEMTHALREKIKIYIKNGRDISELIKDVSLRGEDLSYAIIKDFKRIKDNMSGARFTKAQIGEEGKNTTICNNKMKGSFWDDCQFKGHIFFRRNDCENSDFCGALMHNVEYQFTNFRGCKFCETAIRIGMSYSEGARFSADLFRDLAKMWNLEITVKEE